jgi:threonine dehydrogenase-like Zn-dependent dehydrogenase
MWNGYTEHGIQRLHGFLSHHVIVDQEWVVKLPDSMEPAGILVEPLTVVEKAIRQIMLVQRRMAIWKPAIALVLGAGPVGILATMVLRSVDIVVECTGSAQVSYEAVMLPGKNGAVVLLSVSGHGGEIAVPADGLNQTLVAGNGIVLGSVNAGREDWDTAVTRLETFEDLWPGLAESLITKRIPFDGDISAIARNDDVDGIKTVIEFT